MRLSYEYICDRDFKKISQVIKPMNGYRENDPMGGYDPSKGCADL